VGNFRLWTRRDFLSRAVAPLLILVMVLGLGFIGYNATRAATAKAEDVHLQDRLALQATLADLSSQYLQLALAEASDYGNSQPWSLKPGDPADTRRLSDFVGSSRLLNHGAAILGITGTPLNEASHDGGLPPPTDPGYQPMLAGLVARHPGVSSVIVYKGHPIVALAVPIIHSGTPVAIFVAAFRADQSALESYTQKLSFGKTGTSFILDSRGGVVASHDPRLVGTRLTDAAARKVQAGQRGVLQFDSGSVRKVGSFVPLTVGGWSSLSEQEANEFFGPIRTSSANLQLILLVLLLVAALTLGVLNFKRQEALREAALYDPLTGLYNRRALYTIGEHELKRAARTHTPAALMYVDLDNLKHINDSHGHAAGDEAILAAARVLSSACRSSDIISRVGGDEFCVLVHAVDPHAMVARVREEVERQRATSSVHELGLTVGIALFDPAHPSTIQDLMSDADRSMYFQKRSAHEPAPEAAAGPG
jgi:diguanylate cyclase (GGDEF)-like protein